MAGLNNRRVYVTGTDGRGPRLVPGTRGAYEPLFTLDGDSVVFGRAWRRGMSIWLADLDGGSTMRLTAARRGHHLAPSSFSPDGSKLFVDRYVTGRGEGVAAVDLNTGAVKEVLRRGREPVSSPDGTRLAFTRWGRIRRRDGTRTISTDVFVARADGSGAIRLTKTRFQDEFSPTWDPSGERLAFVRNLSEYAEEDVSIELGYGAAVMQMNADGTCQQVLVKPTSAAQFGTAWQPGSGRGAGPIEC